MVKMAVETEWINNDPFIKFSPTIEKSKENIYQKLN